MHNTLLFNCFYVTVYMYKINTTFDSGYPLPLLISTAIFLRMRDALDHMDTSGRRLLVSLASCTLAQRSDVPFQGMVASVDVVCEDIGL